MNPAGRPRTALEDRFWPKVREDPESGCWIFTGAIRKGYGQIGAGGRGGKSLVAHRVSWELVVGVIPTGLTLDHLCRNKACVNPAHLEPVTMRENIMRGDGLGALNARKTHCLRGHAYTSSNTYRDRRGKRQCRTCWAVRR